MILRRSSMTEKSCEGCVHLVSAFLRSERECAKHQKWSRVTGWERAPVDAEHERSDRILWFGKDRCGPERQHFEPGVFEESADHIVDPLAEPIATRVIEYLWRHWAPPECPSPKPTEYEIMTAALDNLAAQVAANNDVVQSAVTLLSTLKSELDAALASDDTAALQALSDQLGTETSALASAVAANTPAAEQPAPPADDTPPVDDTPAPDDSTNA